MEKKIIRVSLVVLMVFLFSSCIDLLHYIGRDSDGRPMAIVKLTLEKAIFEWAASMGGQDMPTTDEEFAEEFDLSEEEVTEELPEGLDLVYSTVNTSTDFGFQLEIRRTQGFDSAKKLPWLPTLVDSNTLVVPLPEQDSEESSEGGEDEAFLASAKYRVIASKDLCPENPRFFLRGATGELEEEPDVLELPEVYIVEFPLLLWLYSSGELELVALSR